MKLKSNINDYLQCGKQRPRRIMKPLLMKAERSQTRSEILVWQNVFLLGKMIMFCCTYQGLGMFATIFVLNTVVWVLILRK
jgi:hypothetical protein